MAFFSFLPACCSRLDLVFLLGGDTDESEVAPALKIAGAKNNPEMLSMSIDSNVVKPIT